MKKKRTNRALSLLLTLAMCLSLVPSMSFTAFADDDNKVKFNLEDYQWFEFNDNGTEIKSTYLGQAGAPAEIVIPRYGLKSDGTQGGEIVRIHQNAFAGKSLTKVEFEDGSKIKTIGANAFLGNPFTEIKLPTSVTVIGSGAFNLCINLTSVNLSELVNLETIGRSSFTSCPLASINLPNSDKLETIGEHAFTAYMMTPDANGVKSVTIPKSVTSIGYGAFNTHNDVGIDKALTIKLPDHAPGSLADAPWSQYFYSGQEIRVDWCEDPNADVNANIDFTSDSCWILNKATGEIVGLKADAASHATGTAVT